MYLPKHFEQDDPVLLLEVMRQHTFATLVSLVDGAQFATHLPVVASEVDGAIQINGHVARANPHWRGLQDSSEVLVIFHGPHAYISPTHYAQANRVPTWNYIAVHASGQATVQESDVAKLAILAESIGHHEPAYRAQFEALEPQYRSAMLNAIVGFTIRVEQLQGKFKLGQHRLADDKPDMQALHEAGGENERAIATWMQRLGYWQ
ncbi:MAG: FMN-binding negative transcriptional regulator [Herminiimonas sp.]|nr:FMN-binding negative transcriptional regulator [Herminiimonas sp.]